MLASTYGGLNWPPKFDMIYVRPKMQEPNGGDKAR